ncbi:MAG: YlmC/YmxH family sporulation protein [Lachnospiraceae bacterium]|nr:YlmC/YmxH family sporulation protein [Lachnospiraceae bacterium]
MRICDLRQKEVINTCDCKRMGFVDDVNIDIKTGCILDIIVPGPSRFCGLICAEFEYVIPFKCIVQIGDDIIIVKVKEDEVKHNCKFT